MLCANAVNISESLRPGNAVPCAQEARRQWELQEREQQMAALFKQEFSITRRRSSVARAAQSVARAVADERLSPTEKVKQYHEAFEKVKAATGGRAGNVCHGSCRFQLRLFHADRQRGACKGREGRREGGRQAGHGGLAWLSNRPCPALCMCECMCLWHQSPCHRGGQYRGAGGEDVSHRGVQLQPLQLCERPQQRD